MGSRSRCYTRDHGNAGNVRSEANLFLIRGAYDAPREQVHRGVPEALTQSTLGPDSSRLDLARWLTAREHPLTSRVAINRIWQTIFGRGLVETAEDFGLQGAPPSQPELFDWLCADFLDHGWDTKRLLKQIVMSATYQQASDPTARLLEIDPDNRLLARGPAVRLSAEMLRDAALASSGLLVPEMGGPPVKPYQPEGLWEENRVRPTTGILETEATDVACTPIGSVLPPILP